MLKEVLETLAASPHLTSAGLLERFRAHPAAAALGRLSGKYSETIWKLAEDGQEASLVMEFIDTLKRLEADRIATEWERLRQAAASDQGLNAQGQARLRELQAKRQSDLNSTG